MKINDAEIRETARGGYRDKSSSLPWKYTYI
jgi:hypothetical protein